MLAGNLDPTVPISVDIKGRPGYGEQFTYERFDMLGVNQYFGWYRWVADFNDLEPFLYELRDHYPTTAMVMTEFGAEARPELADAPVSLKGSYAFQTMHVKAHAGRDRPRPRASPAPSTGRCASSRSTPAGAAARAGGRPRTRPTPGIRRACSTTTG